MPNEPLIREATKIAHQAADAAARIHRGYAGGPLNIDTKSSDIDLVTEVDRLSEAAIREIIGRAFPDHAILGEEEGHGTRGNEGAAARWIVDPLDGTVNYAHGFPFYSVSIALEIDGQVVLGIVHDSAHDGRYLAVRGEGASYNGAPIAVSGAARVGDALLATGFPYRREWVARSLTHFNRVVPEARAVRRPGSAALDLCMVAHGRCDGFWEFALNAWDVAAGLLIL
jgi:myo-inositol-1(or 4)-monophosphatase